MIVVNKFFDDRLGHLLDLAQVVDAIFASAGVEYRIVDGLAVYLYVEQAGPGAGRLTKDINILVRPEDIHRIAEAAPHYGMQLQDNTLVRTDQPKGRRAVHLITASELPPAVIIGKQPVVPLADLVRMKLTSYRIKDEMHIKDLDEAGCITPSVEATLPPLLLQRLIQTRARD